MVVVRESIIHTLTKLKQVSSVERRVIVEKERGLTVTMSLRAENWYFFFPFNSNWMERKERKDGKQQDRGRVSPLLGGKGAKM
jgi:hypothetical protein